ncbi:MAG: hypothetical protein NC342_01315 [Pseudoflavonifractor sp.]|nr:hypothetical protein [Pseudoflavonifractor sp.]
MKPSILIRILTFLSLVLALPAALDAQGSDYELTGSLYKNDLEHDSIRNGKRPLVINDAAMADLIGCKESPVTLSDDVTYQYIKNRRTLTGESCAVNKIINVVGVGSWTDSLGNVLDDNLSNYAEVNAVVSAGVTVNPVLSVRDRSAYYAKGTEAGFCLVSGSGSIVLSLDVVKAMAIGFYRDGELIGVVPVEDGQSGGGINLGLINIPGSDNTNMYISAKAPGVFDEVCLDFAGGINLSAGQNLRIKYAYVGAARKFTISYNPDNGSIPSGDTPSPLQLYDDKYSSVTMVSHHIPLATPDHFYDADLTNSVPFSSLGIGSIGSVEFMMGDTLDLSREVFSPGTEVGFVYSQAGLVEIGAGKWIEVELYDRDHKVVQKETTEGGVLDLGVVKVDQTTISISSRVPFSGAKISFMCLVNVHIGATLMYYGFINDAPEVRHHCPIQPSAATDVCHDQTFYQLRSNPALKGVTWSVADVPEGSGVTVTGDGYVTGLDIPGKYTFMATAPDGCTDFTTLTYDMSPVNDVPCGTPLSNSLGASEKYVHETGDPEDGVTGGLIVADRTKDREKIVSPDLNDYVTYIGGLGVANNYPIIGVKQVDGDVIYDGSKDGQDGPGKRMGFVVSSSVEGLNLKVLQFMQVRCYYQGKEVYRSVIDEEKGVSADVGGANDNQKMRYSIHVPPVDDYGNYTKVDEIVLWQSGVLSVEGGELHIYYAFVEDASTKCDDPLGCSSELLSTKTHTTLDFNHMSNMAVVAVANASNDFDNIVDDDPHTYMSLASSVDVGHSDTIAINLGRTLDFRHQLGIIMDHKTFAAAVNVGSWLTVETYYNGKPTGDKFNDWNVIDADVAGYGDLEFLYIQPQTVYDEVLISSSAVVSALDVKKFYGIFIRSDIDGDGIPDCQDPSSCDANVTVNDVCVDDVVYITGRGVAGLTYSLSFTDNNSTSDMSVPVGNDGTIDVSYHSTVPGEYRLEIRLEGDPDQKIKGRVDYAVHPRHTVWQPKDGSTDWRKWANWSEGTPYCCTDVVIPTEAPVFPNLSRGLSRGDEYCCDRIHFEPFTKVDNVTRLNYTRAWVELQLTPNRYHLLSSPLKAMVTGDMFVPAEMKGVHTAGYFTLLNETSSPQNRFSPRAYQRLWESTAQERLWAGGYETLGVKADGLLATRWSRNFNHLSTPYLAYGGFSMWIDNETLPEDTQFRLRFPKEHSSYNYYNDYDGAMLADAYESIERPGADMGRFIYEVKRPQAGDRRFVLKQHGDTIYDRWVYTAALPDAITVKAEAATGMSEYFIFGNPFMSEIDLDKFIAVNSETVSGVAFYDGNTYKEVTLADAKGRAIRPMESVLLKAITPGDELSVMLTQAMIGADADDIPDDSGEEAGGGEEEAGQAMLRLTARSGSLASSMSVTGSDAYPVEALFDGEVAPRLALVATSDGRLCSSVPSADRIPLTVMTQGSLPVTLSFTPSGAFDMEQYQLFDAMTGISYPIDAPVTIPSLATSAGRLSLIRAGLTAMDEVSLSSAPYLDIEGRMMTVKGCDNIRRVAIHDLSGRLVGAYAGSRALLPIGLPAGACIVTVTLSDGAPFTYKIMAR